MATIVDFVASGLMTNRTMERINSSVFASSQSTTSPVIRDYTINVPTPDPRSGHTIVYYAGSNPPITAALYMFGGIDATGTHRGELWRFSLSTNLWTQLSPSGTAPSARMEHAMFLYNGLVYVLGGFNGVYLQDLSAYDPTTNTWSAVTVSGSLEIRATFGYCLVGSALYVLGGRKGTGQANTYGDIKKLDLTTFAWSTAKNSAFSARYGISAVAVGTVLYFYGGRPASGDPFEETRSYDTVSNTVSLIDTSGTAPGECTNYNMAVVGSLIYIYGGLGGTLPSNKLFVFNTVSSVWSLHSASTLSYARCSAASAQNGSIMYVDDGATSLAGTSNFSETWAMDLTLHTNTQLPTKQIYINAVSFIYLGVTFTVFIRAGKAYIRMTLPANLGSIGSTLSLKGLRVNA